MSNYGGYGSYGSSYGYDTLGAAGAFLGGLVVGFIIVGLIALVLAILGLIGKYKSYKKAGVKGYEALIPMHSQWVNCNIAGINPAWLLFLTFGSIVYIIPFIGWLIYLGLFGYYSVVLGISTAKAYGKGTGFGIGLAIPISAPIFWFILGGKNVQYVGANPINDPIMGMFDKSNNAGAATVNPSMPQAQTVVETKFCTGCGYKMSSSERFCPGCGKEN